MDGNLAMSKFERGEHGQFVAKSSEYRRVRSLRLTDSTWETLGREADSRGITRADLIEEMVKTGKFANHSSTHSDFDLLVKLEALTKELLENHEVTRGGRDKKRVRVAYEALIAKLSATQ